LGHKKLLNKIFDMIFIKTLALCFIILQKLIYPFQRYWTTRQKITRQVKQQIYQYFNFWINHFHVFSYLKSIFLGFI